jgi:hypothetical protein
MCAADDVGWVTLALGEFMRTITALLVVAVSTTVAGGAGAQTDDLAYCESLYAMFERYVPSLSKGHNAGGYDADAAVDQCRHGNTAAGIAVLEKKLRDNRFSLPAR